MNNIHDRLELLDKFFGQMRIYREIEQKNIQRNSSYIEYFNTISSFLWISLAGPVLSHAYHKIYHDRIDDMPDFALAALLEHKLSSLALDPLQMQGCSIHVEGNTAHFQISASISLDEAKKYLESLEMPIRQQRKKL